MRFLDLFAGIGGFRHGLERAGHVCTGHVEIDKFANKSYMAMYELKYCKFDKDKIDNSCKMCKKDLNEKCNGENCEGEYYAKDIKLITAGEIPKAEIWTFGFPCTDISLSNDKRLGLSGARSGLFFEVTRLIKSQSRENRPEWIIAENVKNILSIKRGWDFTTVLSELSEIGYDCEWELENSKAHGVPQSRERVYIIGHLRESKRSRQEIFPLKGANNATVKQVVGGKQGDRIYDSKGTSITLTATAGGFGGRTGLYTVPCFVDMNESATFTDVARCIRARQNSGITNHKGESSGVLVENKCCLKNTNMSNQIDESKGIFICNKNPKCVRAVITPNRINKRQNGRRFKEVGEPSFCLTCQDQIGVMLCCCDHEKDGCGISCDSSTICCSIRRLTPRECFRLQAFDDYLFDRAKAIGMSDAQLYKQAGNAITTNIAYKIGVKLKEIENGGEADEV